MSAPRKERTGDDAVFRALVDGTRRRLLDALREGDRTTSELVAFVPEMSRFGVMDHLRVLVDAGLVTVRREGRERRNSLNPVPIRRLYERWMRPYAEGVAIELLRLEAAVMTDRTEPQA
jgi:DNA-binding transcriptional ArsR family regulator